MRNKKRIIGLMLAFALVVCAVSTFATSGKRTAELLYSNIKIILNGKEIVPKDANGNTIEPFIIDGTTYLPVRGIASALDLSIGWDNNTQTVTLDTNKVLKAPFTLSAGQYVVGEDIPEGKYDCRAIAGSGNFMGDVDALGFMGLSEILAAPGNKIYGDDRSTYDNLRLKKGDAFEIRGDLKIEFKIN